MTGSTFLKTSLLALLTLLAAACAQTLATRGNIVDDDRLAEVQVGQARKDDVASALGTPTAISTFDSNTWYYVGERTERVAFFKPDVLERKIVIVRFNQAGVVEKIDQMNQDQAQDVDFVDRQTPTAGKDLSFFEQMLGNVGRFGGKKAGGGGPGSPGGT
ncbi:Membrane protein SmpA [uncultured Gammaproteobacteria bacterium]